jgi:hypothetical protein
MSGKSRNFVLEHQFIMLRSILHILLAFNILAASVGVTVVERACNMEGSKQAALAWGDARACDHVERAQSDKTPSCCAMAARKPGRTHLSGAPCCDIKALSLKGNTNAPVRSAENVLPFTAWQAPAMPVPALRLPLCMDVQDAHPLACAQAPPSGQEIRIRFQSFRC